jgi:hypothetical protein
MSSSLCEVGVNFLVVRFVLSECELLEYCSRLYSSVRCNTSLEYSKQALFLSVLQHFARMLQQALFLSVLQHFVRILQQALFLSVLQHFARIL